MSQFIVVGYYTRGTLYEASAQVLIRSLERHHVPHYIEGIENLGTWYKNTAYKPTFLLRMLDKFPDLNIVYVDADAEFLKFPELFDNWSTLTYVKIGVYVFDRSCYKHSVQGTEVLSGTIFLSNCEEVKDTVRRWEKQQALNPKVWDQRNLEKVLGNDFTTMPGEYCKIFDRMQRIKDPVIVHYQHSRKVQNKNHNVP